MAPFHSFPATVASSAGHTVEDEGVELPARTGLNFSGDSVAVSDDAVNDETDVLINHLDTAVHSVNQPSAGVHTHDGTGGGTSVLLGGVSEAGATIPVASTTGSIAIGDFANAGTGTQPIAIGTGQNALSAPSATAQGALAIGASSDAAVAGARAAGLNAIAIGSGDATQAGANAGGSRAIALGRGSGAAGSSAIGIGELASASQNGALAVGVSSSSSGFGSTAVGNTAVASADRATALGTNARATTSSQTVAIGGGVSTTAGPLASAQGAIAIGASNGSAVAGARASGITSIAIGSGDATSAGASASATDAIAVGFNSSAADVGAISIGRGSQVQQDYGVAVGQSANVLNATQGIAIGGGVNSTAGPQANAQGAIAIGSSDSSTINGARATGTNSIAIGSGGSTGSQVGASATGASAIAVGWQASSTQNSSIGIGNSAASSGSGSIALGSSAAASQTHAIAIGSNTTAGTSTQTLAIGGGASSTAGAAATAQGAIALGGAGASGVAGAKAAGANAIAIGAGDATVAGASASAADAIAIGRTALAAHARAVALGQGVSTTAVDQVNIGAKRGILGAPATAPADADLIASQMSWYQDETADAVMVKMKDAASGVFTGGVQIGAWTAYTPVLTTIGAGADPTLGSGSTAVGRYCKVGREVRVEVWIKFGTAGVAVGSGVYEVSRPVTAASGLRTGGGIPEGVGWLYDSSAGTLIQVVVEDQTTTTVNMRTIQTTPGQPTHGTPWTWAASDEIILAFTYQTAA